MKSTIAKKTEGYGYKYTELADINKYCEMNNIRYYQEIETCEINQKDYIVTYIVLDDKIEKHRGCQIVEAVLQGIKNPVQQYGSSLTYCRRYSLLMALGLATEDDDAQSFTKQTINTEEEARNLQITFGKYNGKTIGEIYESGDVKYLEWLFDKSKDEDIKKAVSILTGLVEMTPEETKQEINAMPIQETQKQRIKDKYSKDEIKEILIKLNKSKLSDLTYEEAEDILKGE